MYVRVFVWGGETVGSGCCAVEAEAVEAEAVEAKAASMMVGESSHTVTRPFGMSRSARGFKLHVASATCRTYSTRLNVLRLPYETKRALLTKPMTVTSFFS